MFLFYSGHESPLDADSNSLRHIYGKSRASNGFYASISATSYVLEATHIFPSQPLQRMSAKEFLANTVLPGVCDALTQLYLKKPADPYAFMASYLESIKPKSGLDSIAYDESVLDGHVMKLDEFANVHNEAVLGPRKFKHAWNFRRNKGAAPIFGMGQGFCDGVKQAVDHLFALGNEEVSIINLRDEPTVYIGGKPYSPRQPEALNKNVDYLIGAEGQLLERIERRLKRDVLAVASKSSDKFEVFVQNEDMSNASHVVKAVKENSHTIRYLYDTLQAQKPVMYRRVPMVYDLEPEDDGFDSIIEVMRNPNPHTAVLCQCQAGVGATTTAMVCATILWREKNHISPKSTIPSMNYDHPNYERGEFKCIREFLASIKDGDLIKQQVDDSIDECDHLLNIREVIFKTKAKFDTLSDEHHQRPFLIKRAHNYLRRYFMIIVLGIYAREQAAANYGIAFSQWMSEKWSLKRTIKMLSLDD
eukprot:TRINITY_DN4670_c0_g2_i2.p1 TRINITY_DN4670_c0_g2~~TRINITY_DN4670_c0_g2_i2.p1  ORF type:complete len:475 (-),score=135.98 TRINITY_DN4670_c0_g2_i2:223-1647(-)